MKTTRAQPALSAPVRARSGLSGRLAPGARGVVFALGLALPFAGASYLGQVLAPRLAATTGQGAARALHRLSPARPSAPEPTQEELAGGPTVAAAVHLEPSDARPAIGRKPTKPRARSLMVRAAVVLRAIRAGGRPTGAPIAASGARPAGLILHGISRYGSPLRDGDVLTSISGAKATSPSVVVGAVIAAIQARSPAITGVVWRGQERLTVTVELPLS